MVITARQYGEQMRLHGISWPAPRIDNADVRQAGVNVYRIGGRQRNGIFVLSRRGWVTVYANPAYTDYRKAFDAVMPRTSLGRDVDHLFPKSQAEAHEYIAMGRIGATSNRGWNDDDDFQAMSQKVMNMPRSAPHGYLSQLTDLERGWAVVTCYIRPHFEIDKRFLTKMSDAELSEHFA